jgi:PAS domain-containing protein
VFENIVIFQLLCLVLLGILTGFAVTHLLDHKKSDNIHLNMEEPNPFEMIKWLDTGDNILWSNDAYKKAVKISKTTAKGLELFDIKEEDMALSRHRGQLITPFNSNVHYDITHTETDTGTWYIAKTIQRLADTEAELKRFVQTLADTFSHLPTGLAIFDRHRDLSLFNPALSEILNLGPTWLAKRPSLQDCLNQMHIDGLLPEPKDFKRWRDAFTELEKSDSGKSYQEDWHLPDSRVLRVTARPHLGQAVALMVDDITRRVRVEQKYRGELDHVFSALDQIGHPIVIFDSAGEMDFTNPAFTHMCEEYSDGTPMPRTLKDLCENCSKKFKPTPLWNQLSELGADFAKGQKLSEALVTHSGETIVITASSISGAQVMCEFFPASTTITDGDRLSLSA